MIAVEKENILSVDEFIRLALAEDVGDGDHSSLATIQENETGKAVIKVKEDGIIAGLDLAIKILKAVDPTLAISNKITEGSVVTIGYIVMLVEGNVRSLLKAERLLLNCMQRMSGIASLTRKFVDEIRGTNAVILDTRKTTPNFRQFEKAAVRIGGGSNHRFGLYDMIMIKDNHVDAAGGISNALNRAHDYLAKTGRKLDVEIETRNIEEVKEVLKTGIATRIMLDNFSPALLQDAVKLIDKKFETEASGGITLENVRAYAETGVDFISVGALTHSYKSLDISMKISRK
jgi:nicotinate-nucleotide pyrophosphorylase (carboxylating)